MKCVVVVLLHKHFKAHDTIFSKIHVGTEWVDIDAVVFVLQEEVLVQWRSLRQ